MKIAGKIVGIDIGGTNADGVVIADGKILAKAKIPAEQDNLDTTITTLIEHLLAKLPQEGDDSLPISRIHLSSTLCTNAIACGRLPEVGMLIQSGPGINPDFLECGRHRFFLSGAVDHRGTLIQLPRDEEIGEALQNFAERGLSAVGIACKFSHRNPAIEEYLTRETEKAGFAKNITAGHSISGQANFPRRVYTTWINAALMEQFQAFAKGIRAGAVRLGLQTKGEGEAGGFAEIPVQILKADGGTMPLTAAERLPCEAVYSGPSASIMGALSLVRQEKEDSIILDIGGTTTDIALFADGQPLLEPYGITVMGRPTLIRALNTHSAPLGGDSRVIMEGGSLRICPERFGIPLSLREDREERRDKSEGEAALPGATPSDAMVLLGLFPGDKERAKDAIGHLAAGNANNPQPLEETAREILTLFAEMVYREVSAMIEEVFSRPVYTVSALLSRRRLEAKRIIVVGGPAAAMQEELAKIFALPCIVPEHYEVANAIGVARTRPTFSLSLYANSSDGRVSIPEAGIYKEIDRNFTMADAKEMAADTLREMVVEMGMEDCKEASSIQIDYTEEEEMGTVRGFSSTGKIINLKAQIAPGLA